MKTQKGGTGESHPEIRLLVVDGERDNRVLYETILAGMKVPISSASNGHDALELLERDQFAAVLLDVNMPDIDGFEVAARLRELEGQIRRTPVIFIAGQEADLETVIRRCQADGADYLTKPVNVEVLRAKVRIFVELARIRRQFAIEIAEHQRTGQQLERLNSELEQRVTERTVELADREERLRLALEAANMGTWQRELPDDVMTCDETAQKHFSVGRVSSLAELLERIHPEDRDHVRAAIDRAWTTDGSVTEEYRVMDGPGAWRWLTGRACVQFAGEGADRRGIRVIGTTQDITARKLSEERLRAAEATERASIWKKLRAQAALLRLRDHDTEDLPARIMLATEECARVLGVNRASIWMLDERREDLVCRDLFLADRNAHESGMRISGRQFPAYFAAMQKQEVVVADDVQSHSYMRDFCEAYLAPMGITSMLGAPICVAGTVAGILSCAHTGERRNWTREELDFALGVASYILLAIEADERRRAEVGLNEERSLYGDLVAAHPAGVFRIRVNQPSGGGKVIWDDPAHPPFVFEMMNDQFCEILGIDREALNKKPAILPELVHPEERDGFVVQMGDALTHLVPFVWEGRIVRGDGQIRWVNIVSLPRMIRTGEIVRTGMMLDITGRKRIEERLLLLSTAMESAANGVVIANRAGRLEWVNAAFTKLTGFSRDEVIGKDPRIFKSDLHPPEFFRHMWATILRGEVWHGELKNRRKDGSLYDEEMTITPVTDKEGAVTHFIAVKQDITDRKHAEDTLQRTISFLQATLESTADGLLSVDLNGNITRYNQQFVRLWNVPDEILATHDDKKALEFVRDQLVDPESFIARVKELYEAPDETSAEVLEFKDGRVFESYSQPQRLDGRPIGRVWSFRDVTERKRAEMALRESEARIRATVESALDGIITIDEHGLIEEMNPAALAIFGYTRGEILGRNVSILMAGGKEDAFDKYLTSHQQADEEDVIGSIREVRAKRKSGEEFPMDLAVTEIFVGGQRKFSSFVRDITDRKRAETVMRIANQELERRVSLRTEELEQANKYIQAEMEARERLQAQLQAAAEREQQRIGQDLHDGLCQVLTGAKFRAELIGKKIRAAMPVAPDEFAKIESLLMDAVKQARGLAYGLNPLNAEDIGLMEALERLAASSHTDAGPTCTCQIPEPVWFSDHALATHVYRIAQEAVQNAIKHANPRNVAIELLKKGDIVTLTVTDDGTGMPADANTKGGMGLANMKKRVSLLGGMLQFKPVPGGGTEIVCRFRHEERDRRARQDVPPDALHFGHRRGDGDRRSGK